MQKVGGHADWHSGWDYPLLELERQFWRYPRTAVHGTVAAAITKRQLAISLQLLAREGDEEKIPKTLLNQGLQISYLL